MKKLMEWLRKQGAHKIIWAYFLWFLLWFFLVSRTPFEWLGFWVFVLVVMSTALLLLVFFGGIGSTWDDRP